MTMWMIGDIISALFIPVGKRYLELTSDRKLKFKRNCFVYLLVLFVGSVLCIVDFAYDKNSLFFLPGIIGLVLTAIFFFKLKGIK